MVNLMKLWICFANIDGIIRDAVDIVSARINNG